MYDDEIVVSRYNEIVSENLICKSLIIIADEARYMYDLFMNSLRCILIPISLHVTDKWTDKAKARETWGVVRRGNLS
jgi:hypothetical protein